MKADQVFYQCREGQEPIATSNHNSASHTAFLTVLALNLTHNFRVTEYLQLKIDFIFNLPLPDQWVSSYIDTKLDSPTEGMLYNLWHMQVAYL